jgi:hypothetical protein
MNEYKRLMYMVVVVVVVVVVVEKAEIVVSNYFVRRNSWDMPTRATSDTKTPKIIFRNDFGEDG